MALQGLILTPTSSPQYPCITRPLTSILKTILLVLSLHNIEASKCRDSCGKHLIKYPFGIDDGCGSPFYRHALGCSDTGQLIFRTPSGRYPVQSISYSDPHIIISDQFMWSCQDGDHYRPTRPFSLDTSTRFTPSAKNEYLFFNCSQRHVIIEPKPIICERFPDKCDSTCDSSSFLCRHLPLCPSSVSRISCCSYYPMASESLRFMLQYCTTYTTVYWKSDNDSQSIADASVPDYGVRVDFDIPYSVKCLRCQDASKGVGTCGFNTKTLDFECNCGNSNTASYCNDKSGNAGGIIAGAITGVSVAGAIGIGAGLWFWKKVIRKTPTTCGVETNENRLF